MNDSKQRIVGAMLSYVSIIVNILIQLLYTPFLIKSLGQSEYGLYSLVASIIGYLTIMDLGFSNAIVVYTSRYHAQNKFEEEKKLNGMFNIIFKIIGIISVLVGLIIFLNINNMFGNTMTDVELHKIKIMILILSFNLFLTFSFSIYTSIINAYEKFIFQKIVSIIHSIMKPIIMIPLLFLGYKSITLCIVITILNLIVILSNYIFCTKILNIKAKFLGFDRKILKVIISFSIWIFLGEIVNKINWSADQFILGAVSGTIAVSIYSAASTINQLFLNLSTAVSNVLLPKVSKMVAKNASNEELTTEFIKVGRIQYYIIFLMASGFVLFGKVFFKLWLGNDFKDSYYVALILILPLCFPLIQNLGLSIMQAMNKYKFKSISTVIMSVFNIIISIFLAKKYGAIGAAIGTAIALIICNIVLINIYYYKIIKINVIKFWKEIIILSIKFIPAIIVITIILHYITLDSWMMLIIFAIIYTVVYILNAYFLCMNNYERIIINKVFMKVRGITND